MPLGREEIGMMPRIDIFAAVLAAVVITFAIFFANDFLKDSRSAASVWQPWFTVIGVIAAAFFMVWQQHKISQREAEQRRRKGVAARAVMPAALAEISEYAQNCVHLLAELYPRTTEYTLLASSFPVPQFPSDPIKVLRDCIEHADEADIEPMVSCIQRLQIQNSRISTLLLRPKDKPLHMHEFDSALVDAIDLHACCSSLFIYARFNDNGRCLRKEQYIMSSAKVCSLDEERFPSLFKYMKALRMLH
jgi:hypothetical protein